MSLAVFCFLVILNKSLEGVKLNDMLLVTFDPPYSNPSATVKFITLANRSESLSSHLNPFPEEFDPKL